VNPQQRDERRRGKVKEQSAIVALPIADPENTYLFSDPHFGHTNIIKYCSRPFRSTEEMDDTILRNFCAAVRTDSLVIFLGDMSFGRGSTPPRVWLGELRKHVGRFVYLKGSHDHGVRPTNTPDCYERLAVMRPESRAPILLVHEPYNLDGHRGWVIHGHTHNNTPFFDRERKRVNVSVEATDYKPVKLSYVWRVIGDTVVDAQPTIQK
jgi:calcineurin-like phosphoesterase family protein